MCGTVGTVPLLGRRTGREMAMQEQRPSVSWVRDAERIGLELEDEPECPKVATGSSRHRRLTCQPK